MKPRIDWRPILLEAFFVVLGVVLALAANEVRRSYVDRSNARTALASVREELRINRAAVLEAAEYHLHLGDTLTMIARSASRSEPGASDMPDGRLFARGFFHPATLLHTAWDASAATGAVRHMNYADVLRLSRIYEEQDRYRGQSEQVGQLIYAHLFSGGYQGVAGNYANLSTILAAFWFRECQLLRRYDELLAQFGDGSGEAFAVPERCDTVLRATAGSS